MKINLLAIFLVLMIVPIVYGITQTLNDPDDFYETTSTSTVFNWTVILEKDSITESSLYINDVLNMTLDCDNSTYPFPLEADVTGSTTATWNTSAGNDTITIEYTNSAVVESCTVTFTQSETLSLVYALANATSGCTNLTVSSSGSALRFTTNYTGANEYINITGGNATSLFGFTTGTTTGYDAIWCNTTVTGMSVGFYQWYVKSRDYAENATITGTETETFNTTLNWMLYIDYSVSGVAENCSINFGKTGALIVTDAMTNITANCNLSSSNSTGSLKLITTDSGSDEYINITGGNATSVFGFTVGDIQYGSETFSSTETRWMEVREALNETFFRWGDSTTTVMWLNRALGNLNISGLFTGLIDWNSLQNYPVECPPGTYITKLNDSVTCTSTVKSVVVGSCNSTNEGIMAYNESTKHFYGCNSTDWVQLD